MPYPEYLCAKLLTEDCHEALVRPGAKLRECANQKLIPGREPIWSVLTAILEFDVKFQKTPTKDALYLGVQNSNCVERS